MEGEAASEIAAARSNVSNSLKELQAWRIVKLVHVLGDKRDHFESMSDVWEMFRLVLDERKRREVDPTLAMLQECLAAGFPPPRAIMSTSAEQFLEAAAALGHPGLPVVAKLPHSNGMRGLRVIAEDAWDVGRFVRDKPSGVEIGLNAFMAMLQKGGPWPELLVTEFLPGREYTVDVFAGLDGSTAVVRLRRTIRSGITFEAEVLPRSQLAALSCALGEHLALRFAFGFQWKEDERGEPRILECNPRVQGTMVASTLAGVNIVWLAIREALGVGPSRAELRGLRPQPISFKRFWGGGAERDGLFVET